MSTEIKEQSEITQRTCRSAPTSLGCAHAIFLLTDSGGGGGVTASKIVVL